MNKIIALTHVFVLAVLILLAALTWNAKDELARLDRQLAQTEERVNAQLQQQSNAINRALGTQIPLRLSPDLEEAIRAIEETLRNESKWPKEQAVVKQLNERLGRVVDALPPWAQEEVLPRLLPRRWEIDALWLLAGAIPGELAALLDYQLGVNAHLESKPGDASEVLRNRLASRGDEVAKAVRQTTIENAGKAISKGDVDEAIRLVGSLSDDEGKEVKEQLQIAVAERDLRGAVDTASKTLARASNVSDLSLKARAVSRVRDAVMDMRIRLLLEPRLAASIEPTLNELREKADRQLEEAEKAQSAKASEALRNYQVWALGEIKKVRKLKDIETDLLQKIPSAVDRNIPLSEPAKGAVQQAKRELREAMVRHLAPINQAVLDVAVGQWFQKVYQQRFESLDEKNQLEVITQFSVAVKKAVE